MKTKPVSSSTRQLASPPNVGNSWQRHRTRDSVSDKEMSPESGKQSSAHSNDVVELNFKETELTLALPGESHGIKTGTKRGFSETVDLNLGRTTNQVSEQSGNKSAAPKAQMVGWPPVSGSRKNVVRSCKYVKVAVDGAPYLRKVDLQVYESYEQLLKALETMFSCLTIRSDLNERRIVDSGNGVEYVPTYEDKDGDWMLVGDVPWKMFAESCRRIRLMISSEAIGLAPRTPSQCTGSS